MKFLGMLARGAVGVLAAWASAGALAGPPATLALPFDWYPESVAAGPDGSLYVGSWRQGAVVRVHPWPASRSELLVPPGANGLANGQGVLVDAQRGLLWVCSGNSGFTTVPQTPSALKSYVLSTGAPRASHVVPDAGYCNDLAQDARGNLYVTDSLHPRVLQLAPGAKELTVWRDDPMLEGEGPFKGLNGIAIDGDAVYVSTVAASRSLMRIALNADASAGPVRRIAAPRLLKNVDAIRTWKPGRLVLFESNAFGSDGPYGGQITVANIDDRQMSLRTVVAGLNDPSSGVIVGRRVYFIESKYPLLLRHKDDPAAVPRDVPFDLQSRELPAD